MRVSELYQTKKIEEQEMIHMGKTNEEMYKEIGKFLEKPMTKQNVKVVSFYKHYGSWDNEVLTEKVLAVGHEQVLKVVEENGFFNQCTEEDVEKFKKGEICQLSWDNDMPEYDEPMGYSVWVGDIETLEWGALAICLESLKDIENMLSDYLSSLLENKKEGN